MKTHYILLIGFLILFHFSEAQKNIRFSSILQAGLLTGSSEPAFQVQTVNGLKCGNYTAGIGVGIDNYYFKSVPLFLDLRRNFLHSAKAFVYADLGANFPWKKINDEGYEVDKYSAGYYFDAGIGYTIAAEKKVHVDLSLGYSQKTSKVDTQYPASSEPFYTNINEYTFRRYSFKLAVGF
jgi:hypothetical protein